jgi:hypothetical protein
MTKVPFMCHTPVRVCSIAYIASISYIAFFFFNTKKVWSSQLTSIFSLKKKEKRKNETYIEYETKENIILIDTLEFCPLN